MHQKFRGIAADRARRTVRSRVSRTGELCAHCAAGTSPECVDVRFHLPALIVPDTITPDRRQPSRETLRL